MILLIISLPILGSLISGLLGRHLGFVISKWIATICIMIPCILSYILFYQILINGYTYKLLLGNWINIDYINIDWGFIIDELTISLLVPICTISSLVHLYSISYMSHDPHQQRFFSILSLFTAFMIVLVTGNNYLVMFVGWELIGVASYLLISHWYTRINAIKSGLNALLVNKFGDMLLTIGLYLILFTFGTLNYNIINSLTAYINTDIITIIMLCLLIGAMAKSAQLGLHTWLLNSMEGWKTAFPKSHYILEHPNKFINPNILIQKLEQSVGNNNNISTPETKRETYIFNSDTKNNNKYLSNSDFIDWFIGFTEGDGAFITNKTGRKNLEFKVTQSIKDIQILYYIKQQLNFGIISLQDIKNNTYHFRVRDEKNLLKIINIFNGKLRLPSKQKSFKIWLQHYNNYYKTNIQYIENNKLPTLNDAWLSGFTDAEGCFYSNVYKPAKRLRTSMILVKYILSQKGNEEFMKYLSTMLKGNITHLKSYNGYNITVNKRQLPPIINYFNKYPLKTKKYISYLRWLHIYNRVIINKNITEDELDYLKKQMKKINKF